MTFCEDLSETAVIELFDDLSQALRNEDIVIRITGAKSMAVIASWCLALCPNDTLLTVETRIIHQGPRSNVLIEVLSRPLSESSPT